MPDDMRGQPAGVGFIDIPRVIDRRVAVGDSLPRLRALGNGGELDGIADMSENGEPRGRRPP
jgi:hypothetical protein